MHKTSVLEAAGGVDVAGTANKRRQIYFLINNSYNSCFDSSRLRRINNYTISKISNLNKAIKLNLKALW